MSTPEVPFWPMTHDDAQELIEAVRPTNVYVDLPVSIQVSDWSVSAPYRYTWLNSNVTPECGIEVAFGDGAEDVDVPYLKHLKVAGGVRFEVDEKPSEPLPVIVRVINAKADMVIDDIDATMVSTEAIPGVTSVEQALSNVDTRVTNNSDAIANIATVISGTTNNSGHAISAGEYFIANGAKYKASATIDTGATWSNKATSVSDHDLINALNSKITTQTGTITMDVTPFSTPSLKKTLNIVAIEIEINGGFTADTDRLIGTLPVGFRPSHRQIFPVCVDSGAGILRANGICTIKVNGEIVVNVNQSGFVPLYYTFIV